MKFREFLILEADDSGSDWFYGNSVYPSDAFDWPDQFVDPANFIFLQNRWKKERDEWGRKFYGLDPSTTINNKFISVYSKTMPNNDKWKHSNKERPNIVIDKDAKLELQGIRSRAKISKILWKGNNLIDKTEELNKRFGKFNPSFGNLPDNFDKPWSPYTGEVKMKRKKQKTYSKNLNNFPQK